MYFLTYLSYVTIKAIDKESKVLQNGNCKQKPNSSGQQVAGLLTAYCFIKACA